MMIKKKSEKNEPVVREGEGEVELVVGNDEHECSDGGGGWRRRLPKMPGGRRRA